MKVIRVSGDLYKQELEKCDGSYVVELVSGDELYKRGIIDINWETIKKCEWNFKEIINN